jgi:moderate conductance mechanosensitive channel
MPAWKRIFVGPVEWHLVAIAIVAVSAIAWLAARLAKRTIAAAIRAVLSDTLVESSPVVRGPLRFVGAATFVLVFSVLLFPAFEVLGLQPRTGVHLSTLAAWTFASGLRILLIFILAYALVRTIGVLVKRFEAELNRGTGLDALERAKRARTLGSVVNKGATVLIVAIAVVMVMKELHLDIGPVLTSAGIAGVALGFGAQWLVRDIISGFFLILEDQVRVGDVAAINGVGGLVEELNLRTIVLRDIEGTVHVFPNGAINTLANKSKDFSFYVMDLGVSYREDPDRIAALLRKIGEEMQADPSFGSFILAPIEVLGIDAFTDWALLLKVRIKTVPLKQWDVGRELRRRIKKAFDAEGIEIPFPERIVTVRDERDLAEAKNAAAGG